MTGPASVRTHDAATMFDRRAVLDTWPILHGPTDVRSIVLQAFERLTIVTEITLTKWSSSMAPWPPFHAAGCQFPYSGGRCSLPGCPGGSFCTSRAYDAGFGMELTREGDVVITAAGSTPDVWHSAVVLSA